MITTFNEENSYLTFWCPGCDLYHSVRVNGAKNEQGAGWKWDGNRDKPTISPSLVVTYTPHASANKPERRCHSFIRNGVWQFLKDCTHSLAGKHVPMVEIP